MLHHTRTPQPPTPHTPTCTNHPFRTFTHFQLGRFLCEDMIKCKVVWLCLPLHRQITCLRRSHRHRRLRIVCPTNPTSPRIQTHPISTTPNPIELNLTVLQLHLVRRPHSNVHLHKTTQSSRPVLLETTSACSGSGGFLTLTLFPSPDSERSARELLRTESSRLFLDESVADPGPPLVNSSTDPLRSFPWEELVSWPISVQLPAFLLTGPFILDGVGGLDLPPVFILRTFLASPGQSPYPSAPRSCNERYGRKKLTDSLLARACRPLRGLSWRQQQQQHGGLRGVFHWNGSAWGINPASRSRALNEVDTCYLRVLQVKMSHVRMAQEMRGVM